MNAGPQHLDGPTALKYARSRHSTSDFSRSQRQQISSAIQVIVQVNRVSDGTRKITSITELTGIEGEVITMQEIFKYNQSDVNAEGVVQGNFGATGVRPKLAELLKSRGVEFREDMFDPTIE